MSTLCWYMSKHGQCNSKSNGGTLYRFRWLISNLWTETKTSRQLYFWCNRPVSLHRIFLFLCLSFCLQSFANHNFNFKSNMKDDYYQINMIRTHFPRLTKFRNRSVTQVSKVNTNETLGECPWQIISLFIPLHCGALKIGLHCED